MATVIDPGTAIQKKVDVSINDGQPISEKVFLLEIWSTGNVTSEKTIEVKGEEKKFSGTFRLVQFKFDKNYNYIYTKIADSQKEFDKKYNGTALEFSISGLSAGNANTVIRISKTNNASDLSELHNGPAERIEVKIEQSLISEVILKSEGEIWNSTSTLATDKSDIPTGTCVGDDDVLLCSRAGENKRFDIKDNYIQWTGDRTRIYLDFYRLGKALTDSEIEFKAIMNEFMDNISVKLGNHEVDSPQYCFGGYGVAFATDRMEVQIEYWHNDHTKEKHYPLTKKLPIGKEFGCKVRTENSTNGKKINAWIDYDNNNNNTNTNTNTWTQTIKDFEITDNEWKPPQPLADKVGQDLEDIKKGVYKGICHQWWIRLNTFDGMETKSLLKIRDIKIRSV